MSIPLKCRIRAEGGVTRVDVYDDIGEGGWFSEGLTAKSFASQLAGVKGALEVHVNSGGGDVFDGLAIGEAIRSHKGPVTVHVDGIAASIASVIVQAAEQRVMAPGAMMMIHDAFGGVAGNEAEVAKFAETLGKVSANIAAVYAGRAGGSPDSWRAAMKAETWYTADEAVAAGLADRTGSDEAQLPAGFDLAAFSSVPGRIAAALRSMPPVIVNAAPMHPPLSVTHSHKGPNGEAEQEHTHSGDASHEGVYDPDGDGDDDSSAEGDTDHDYVKPDGSPGPKALTEDRLRAVIREELRAALRNAEKYDTEDRKAMAEKGHAMPDGSYPIADAEDLDDAIHAVGRGGADHDSIRAHIIKRAAALGLSSKIPDNWNADGSLKDLSDTEILALFARELDQLNAGKE